MEKLALELPDGELILNPAIEDILECLKNNEEYWDGGSGSAYLGWVTVREPGYSTNWERPALHIIVHEPFGIHFGYVIMNYQPYTKNLKLMTYLDEAPRDILVMHYLGGEPSYFPNQSFVPFELAVQVIKDFLQTGEPSPTVTWRPEIEAQYAGPSYG